ncbi:MAG: hypothetical protein E6J89_06800 [Deltaproteobacteria bacterium]|nr:MAG: hypothetical protein E6J89_06800 [Deltaproteobacteria bacterium]
MARIPLIEEKKVLAAEHHKIYDAIAQSRGTVRGPFAALLHSSPIAERTAHLGAYIRFESQLEPKIVELAALATARELDCRKPAFPWRRSVRSINTKARKASLSKRLKS